jgi:XTP/dITP diphosphohydrolase
VTQDPKDPESVPAPSPGSSASSEGQASSEGPASPDTPGIRLLNLVAVMDRLRTECPWDAKQTHESLAPYLLEETYEALEALEGGDPADLREELGDVLLQVLFHARVASERADGTGYTIDDVADGIASKLVRRHPHVFGDVTVAGAGEVKQNWDAIKAAERAAARAASGGGGGSVLDGVPFGQPALSLAAQLQRRAGRAGVPAELADLASIHDPVRSGGGSDPDHMSSPASSPASVGGAGPRVSEVGAVTEVGAALFALVTRACEAGLDPELELRAAARAYRDRVLVWERWREHSPES